MTILLISIFVVGYVFIALEHSIHLNKAASAIITGVLCWTIYFLSGVSSEEASESLLHHMGEISSILFFLLGAMTIVELIDSHQGFDIIKNRITTKSQAKLLVIITAVTFFLSALLDNLTTAIVMTSLCSKLLDNQKDRLWFAGMIIIAANAGGVWSPLGDVTTTMLWIGGQITAFNIITTTFLPSIFVCLVPMLILVFRFRNKRIQNAPKPLPERNREGSIILIAGVALLIFVPVFKTLTHTPPFMGMLLALGIMWIIAMIIHSGKPGEEVRKYSVTHALEKIDTPSVLFFLGILLAVTALQSYGLLGDLAGFMDRQIGNDTWIAVTLGLLSALIDNVPLVAAAQGMYDLAQYPTDHPFWELLALTTGTGGSAIIIGSAAGVAVMGIEKISFLWYMKNISWLALTGFCAGILIFLLQQALL